MNKQAAELKLTNGEACLLLAENKKDEVGKGIVDNMEPTAVCYGVRLGPDYIRITLTECLAVDYPLQRPHAGAKTLGESKGSFLAWPKALLKEVGTTILLEHIEPYH